VAPHQGRRAQRCGLLGWSEHACHIEQATGHRTLTLRSHIATHAIDQLEEARVGADVTPQNGIALQEAENALAAVIGAP
jgi:hypothetical protein